MKSESEESGGKLVSGVWLEGRTEGAGWCSGCSWCSTSTGTHRDSWVGGGRKLMVRGDGRPVERVNSFPQARRCGRLFDPTIKAALRVLRVLRQGQGFRVRLVTAPTASYSGSSLAPRCRAQIRFCPSP